VSEIHLRYYVILPTNSTTINWETTIYTINVIVNIDETTPKLEVGNNNFIITIQQGLANDNLFFLLHMLARKTQGRKSLVDYSQNHVVTLEEYLNKLRSKALEKGTLKIIK
jgi:hypothetical protein